MLRIALTVFLSCVAIMGSCPDASAQKSSKSSSYAKLMEIPSVSAGDVIISHKGYVISYNNKLKIPNWVAYELTSAELSGSAGREDKQFGKDPSCRGSQAMREDYAGSGWTRGHMACAADFHWNDQALGETFYLTNICPQNEKLNAGDWNYLEKQVRAWAKKYGKVWVVSGPLVGDGLYGTIGSNHVTVPDAFFKAVLVNVNGKYRSIAFIMGNDSGRYYLSDCSVSVNELEDITGLDFFPNLSDSVEESVEEQLRLSDWGIRAR